MESIKYNRKSFEVNATEITEENIAEISSIIGTLYIKDDGTHFIQLNRHMIPNVFRAYPGFWLTEFNGNYQCYSRKAFFARFEPAE